MAQHTKAHTMILWAARISGSLILLFILTFVVAYLFGEDESGNGFQSTVEVIAFIFFPVSTLIGLTVAYWKEGLGGIITTAGIFGLLIMRPDLIATLLMVPMIPGALYITYWIMKDKNESPPLQSSVDKLQVG